MPRPRYRLTYRFRQLPQHLAQGDVADFLCKVSADFGPQSNIQVFSLAHSLLSWETLPTKTATLVFRSTPKPFDNDEREWTVPARNVGWNRDLIFDVHFNGFTALNDVDESIHLADCIAISGLASHPLGSWMQRGSETNFIWLREKLPEDVPNFRQIIYGYDTSLTSNESFQVIDDLAASFIGKLKSMRRSSTAAKPLIFFAHSLGGIILKHALVALAGSFSVEDLILEKTHSIFFFASPHLGMEMSHLLAIVQGQPNEPLVRALSNDDGYLSLLDEQFCGIATFSKVRIFSFYETKLSRAAQISAEGALARTSELHVAVSRLSAVHRRSEIRIPINKDHSNVVKFSQHDPDYEIVVSCLHDIASSFSPRDPILSEDVNYETANRSITTKAVPQIPDAGSAAAEISVDESNLDEAEQQLNALRKLQEEDEKLMDESRRVVGEKTPIGALADRMSKRGDFLNRLEEQVKTVKKNKDLRKSLIKGLYIPTLEDRFEKIEDSSIGTFSWIFENTELNFANWLRSETGTYWIKGKPGSGKSTLMKYLHNHPRTSNMWKPERLIVDVWYFLDDRGSHIQKSLEGILHAILHRVTSSDKRLADIILPMYANKHPDRRDTWPLCDLQNALMQLLNQDELDLDLNLFLDALDEYGDSPEVIADFVADMSDRSGSRTRTKVCFSSRPWNVFRDRFDQCPGFNIHEHTKSDIRRFIRGAFVENGLMAGPGADLESASVVELLSDIAGRAQGVFLWAKLVCADLVRAYHNGASFIELRQLVSEFPQELEGYYARIVERLPQSSRFEAFAMLDVVRAKSVLSLEDFSGAISCAIHETSQECVVNPVSNSWSHAMLEKTTRHLRDYTGGLLEVVFITEGPIVQFMHQTVKVFVSRPGFMRRLLGSEAKEICENGHSFLAKYYIAKTLATSRIWNNSVAEGALLGMLHAHLSETTTGMSQRVFLDSLDDNRVAQGFQRFLNVNSRLSLAVVADLRLYVSETLKRVNTVNRNPSLSLLYCLTSFTNMRAVQDRPFWTNDLFHGPTGVPWGIVKELDLTEMCQILLEFGASTATRSESLTPFQSLFAPRVPYGGGGHPSSPQSQAITRVLLKRGQDPDCGLRFNKLLPGLPNCRPIHLADAEMSRLLLEFGADVNALDDSGRTPLDIAISPNPETLEFESMPEKVYDRISVLLDHDAYITNHGEKHLKRCLNWLEEYSVLNRAVSARLEEVPRLDSSLENRLASPDKSMTGQLILSENIDSISRSSSKSRLARGITELAKRHLAIRTRWTSPAAPVARQSQGEPARRQSNSSRNTGV